MNPYNSKNTLGQGGFYFFFGVVEDRNDPMKIGRVKVRCYGIHDENLNLVPKEHLPWATVVAPTTNSESAMPYLPEGCNVFGFFVDGMEMQVPVVIGTTPGIIGKQRHLDKGFYDPRPNLGTDQPGHPTPNSNGITEPSERPIRGLNESSISAYAIQGSRLVGASKAVQKVSNLLFNEPSDPYAGKYPFVHAQESESGHVIELDDTPGSERVHVFHRAGSYVEMHPDGTVVQKSIKDGYSITNKDGYVHVGGNVKIFVGGDSKIHVVGDGDVELEGNLKVLIGGTATVSIPNGNLNIDVNDTINVNGNIVVSGDVIASGISLVNHKHKDVEPGIGLSGKPV